MRAVAPEWQVLLECASPYPDPTRLAQWLKQSLNWPALLNMAEAHGVTGHLAARLPLGGEELVPAEIQQELQERDRAQSILMLSMTAELFRLLERFAAARLEVLVIKGPVLSARAYGDPRMRHYADLDLLVRQADILRTTELLAAAGYKAKISPRAISAGKIPGEYLFTRAGKKLLLDLHTERTLRYYARPVRINELFERKTWVSLDAHVVPAFAMEDELLLTCVHGAKHLWDRLMWVADVAALVTRETNLDWERVIAAAQEAGANRMLHTGLRLAADSLRAPLSEKIAPAVQKDKAASRLAKQIMRWLPSAGFAHPRLFERALFRVRMRGGLLSGPAYFLRLALSPTEEDWVEGREDRRSGIFDVQRRLMRLARKYGPDGKI